MSSAVRSLLDGRLRCPAYRSRPPETFSPVFLLAPARSYSSVVTQMLGQHPDMYSFPELVLFQGDAVDALFDPPPGVNTRWHYAAKSGLIRALAELVLRSQERDALEEAYLWLRAHRHLGVDTVFDELLALVAPRIGIEKSPQISARDEYLHRMRRSYPRAKFLHLVRHPIATQRSMQRHWEGKAIEENLPRHCARIWYLSHLRIVAFSQELPSESYLRVHAEDVINDGGKTLSRIAHWLSIRTDDEAMESMLHPERSPYVGPAFSGDANDPGFVRDPALRRANEPTSIQLPAEWGIDDTTAKGVYRVAEFLGYS